MKKHILFLLVTSMLFIMGACSFSKADYEVIFVNPSDEEDYTNIAYQENIADSWSVKQEEDVEKTKYINFNGKDLTLYYSFSSKDEYNTYETVQYIEAPTDSMSTIDSGRFIFRKDNGELTGFITPTSGKGITDRIEKSMSDDEIIKASRSILNRYWDVSDYTFEKVERFDEDSSEDFLAVVSIHKKIFGMPSAEGCRIAFRKNGDLALAGINMKNEMVDDKKIKIDDKIIKGIIEEKIKTSITAENKVKYKECRTSEMIVVKDKDGKYYLSCPLEIIVEKGDSSITCSRLAYVKLKN